jgi:protein gp37
MGATSIEWTARTRIDGTIVPGFTFNPWIGCSKIDPLCANCYASVDTFTRVNRSRGRELWGPDAERHVTSSANWLKPIKWDRDAAAAGELRGVFCASLADICEDRRDLDAPREWLWELIRWCDSLDFMLLTKRPQNIGRLVPQDILDRVWMGVSAGTVAGLKRVELLMRHRAFRRFVSAEPLLEDIDFDPMDLAYRDDDGRPVDLVIVGCESGHRARRTEDVWVRGVRENCAASGVSFFLKQLADERGRIVSLPVLDGRQHQEMPEARP